MTENEHQAIDFDEELLKELANAPEFRISDSNLITVGKVWISDLNAKRFNGKGNPPVKREYKLGATLKDGEWITYTLHQDVSEMSENWRDQFWYVEEQLSGITRKTDFGEITAPSTLKVFKSRLEYLKAILKGTYVAIEHVPTGRTRKGTNRSGVEQDYPVLAPKFIVAFKNKKAAKEYQEEKFTKKENSNNSIPSETVMQVKALLLNFDEAKVLEMLADGQLGDYDPAELIEAAK